MICVTGDVAGASQAPNPRGGATVATTSSSRGATGRGVTVSTTPGQSATNASRAATRRTVVSSGRGNATSVINATTTQSARTAARQNVVNIGDAARGDTVAARSATPSGARSATNAARAGTNVVAGTGVSRAASSRATAVFTDVSKIGGGYSQCREAYSTCMDQFCAMANDTYRRCFCSSKYQQYRDTEAALDEAKNMLLKFEDNNLNAVDKTAAEVSAMYSATAGEMAIKQDVSGAAAMLEEIGDLLSGKKKPTTESTNANIGFGALDFSADIDDIWGETSVNSIFETASRGGADLAALEGVELYNSANSQCLKLVGEACTNDAVLSMARSSYSILINQDCNAYEKRINSTRETVLQTVRTAEKYLREARLEEYRAHNSADVNECVAKVKAAMTTDAACGPDYVRCLDYSGVYINQTTGEPIYSQRLFQLVDLIKLDGVSSDVIGQNPDFNTFLDSKRMYATSALDTCRDQADLVWSEFKRTAIIEIAQAQDEKIEEVKMSCVNTMKECYDTQSKALKSFDNTTAQMSGAISAYAAKNMCQDKVIACASLYGNTTNCKFDGNGRLVSGNNNPDGKTGNACGLTALLEFVDNVDDVRIAEGCTTAINSYTKSMCTPSTGTQGYPWNCRNKIAGTINDGPSSATSASLVANIKQFAVENCSDPSGTKTWDSLPSETKRQVELAVNAITEELEYQLIEECERVDGFWQDPGDKTGQLLTAFYSNVFGGRTEGVPVSLGRCVENTTMIQCLAYNADVDDGKTRDRATYDRNRDECVFSEEWYKERCSLLGNGYFENGVCYILP